MSKLKFTVGKSAVGAEKIDELILGGDDLERKIFHEKTGMQTPNPYMQNQESSQTLTEQAPYPIEENNKNKRKEKTVVHQKPVPEEIVKLFEGFDESHTTMNTNLVTISCSLEDKEFLRKTAAAAKLVLKKNVTVHSLVHFLIQYMKDNGKEGLEKLFKAYEKQIAQ